MGQCCPGAGPGPIYKALRHNTLARVTTNMDLSLLRLNFDPSRHFRQVYCLGRELGEGSFGSVYTCTRRLTGEERAVKQLLKSRMKDGGEDVLNELEVLAKLDHPNVVKFFEFFEDDLAVLAVTELCEEGDFTSLLPRGTAEESVRLLYRDVMLGLAYCHSFGIVHRDLKFANCVVTKGHDRAMAKIIDFGLSVFRRAEDQGEEWLYETCGTAAFQAPEVLERSYGEKCDVWSFGIMVLMQLQGSDAALARAASFGSARFEQLEMHMDAMSRELEGNQAFRLAQRLLCRDPAKRPDAQAALKNSWLRPPSVQAQEAAPNSLTRKDSRSLRRSLSAYTKLSHFDKVVLLMASNVSAQRSDFCRKTSKIFMSTDTDSSGFLNQEELRRALAACGLKADDAEAEELWRALDASEDGRVTHSEWVSATLAPGALKSAKVAQELFAWLDTDGSGSVSLQELRRLVSEEDALEVLDSADTSRDGLLSFEEFTYLIRSIASRRYGEGLASSSDSEDEAAD